MLLPPESAPGPDHGKRRGPAGWSGPLLLIFLALAAVFTVTFVRAGHLLSALGVLVTLMCAAVLARWRKREL